MMQLKKCKVEILIQNEKFMSENRSYYEQVHNKHTTSFRSIYTVVNHF